MSQNVGSLQKTAGMVDNFEPPAFVYVLMDLGGAFFDNLRRKKFSSLNIPFPKAV